ncbi:hypothetical protein G7046_g7459 [Stylonectria norvegica]|nr:hypothetical protein G7046_g7459 [Stylonectria norvegica]
MADHADTSKGTERSMQRMADAEDLGLRIKELEAQNEALRQNQVLLQQQHNIKKQRFDNLKQRFDESGQCMEQQFDKVNQRFDKERIESREVAKDCVDLKLETMMQHITTLLENQTILEAKYEKLSNKHLHDFEQVVKITSSQCATMDKRVAKIEGKHNGIDHVKALGDRMGAIEAFMRFRGSQDNELKRNFSEFFTSDTEGGDSKAAEGRDGGDGEDA